MRQSPLQRTTVTSNATLVAAHHYHYQQTTVCNDKCKKQETVKLYFGPTEQTRVVQLILFIVIVSWSSQELCYNDHHQYQQSFT